ncbi:putative porin [Paraburkholderia bannensis]|uniref:Putative porin n=1 Tax=Paraburkholderia bannensis TaxID=765414 RepID=A0A7W9TXX9_9BURK|nr:MULTISPECIES: porin [Paraburkholderia]MBB3257224.1 putative porin [Paraburkholderia sp. WP4_3_2]MBB6102380.1 putative porin [Paraburkholderia bannensis]
MGVACGTASSAARAQSSVTLYGSLDAGVGYVSNLHGSSAFIAEQGTLQADRFGLIGVEDLGAGRSALFRLESGFVTTTGASASSTSFFNRQAYVGLSDPAAGTVTLGRQTDWNFDWLGSVSTGQVLGDFSAFHPGNLDGLGSTLPVQLSNVVKWKSAPFYGLTLGALYGFPGAAASNTSGRTLSFGANYTRGPLKLVGVWSEYNDRLLPLATALGLTSFQERTLPAGATFLASRVRDAGVGGSYQFGKLTVHLLGTDVRIASAGGADHFRSVDGGLNLRVTPAEEVAVGAWSAWLDGKRWTQATLANVYSLSKTTQLYADLMYETAGGGAVADTLGIGASSGKRQIVVLSGIHHLF